MFTYAHTYSIYVLLESVCPGHYFVILFSLFATYLSLQFTGCPSFCPTPSFFSSLDVLVSAGNPSDPLFSFLSPSLHMTFLKKKKKETFKVVGLLTPFPELPQLIFSIWKVL